MRWFKPKTVIATVGSVVLPLLALAYLASIPGKKSAFAVVIQVAIIIGALILFGLLLSKVIEQMNAGRVARWLETTEGREWLESLPDEEREAFQGRFESFQ